MRKIKLTKNRFLQNTSWIVGANLVQMVLSFIIGMISARYLGPSNFGVINYAAAIVAFFISPAQTRPPTVARATL